MSLDGFSMRPLVHELQQALVGGRIDKITQPSKQSILLSIRQPGRNLWLHLSIQPQNPMVHLLESPLENPSEPPVFCMVLRKQIETGRIADVRQQGLDRLLFIDIDFLAAGGEILTKTLAIELMGKYSNIILLQNDKIIDVLRKVGPTNSRVRTVLPGQIYVPPPAQDKLNLFQVPLTDILAALRTFPDKKLTQALLSVCLGFGPVSAKETAFSAGLSPNLCIEAMDDSDFVSLGQALQEIKTAASQTPSTACLITDTHKKVLAMAAFPLHYLTENEPQTFPSISAMLRQAARYTGSYVPPDKEKFSKLVHTEKIRAQHKAEKLTQELADAQNAEEYKEKADNLMTYQYQLKDHQDAEITLENIYHPTGEKIRIALDQRLTIIQNMQAYYHKYDKLKRAQELLKVQLAQCQEELRYLESIETSLVASATLAEINDIRAELIQSGYLHEKAKKKSLGKPSRPFKFYSPEGSEILVGKNNYQNDQLTFKIAHFKDLWFHTKDIPGSHVLLRCAGETPSEKDILLTAQLAAHFSKARGSSKIPVDYTFCRYVKKPSGAKPGFVIFTNQKTLYVTPNEEELAPLLAKDHSA